MIVNKKTGVAEVDHELLPPSLNPRLAPNPKIAQDSHGQFRRGRIAARGTCLVSWMSLGRVMEYEKDFKEIWSYNTSRPCIKCHRSLTASVTEDRTPRDGD
jgi:hypothetical protein